MLGLRSNEIWQLIRRHRHLWMMQTGATEVFCWHLVPISHAILLYVSGPWHEHFRTHTLPLHWNRNTQNGWPVWCCMLPVSRGLRKLSSITLKSSAQSSCQMLFDAIRCYLASCFVLPACSGSRLPLFLKRLVDRAAKDTPRFFRSQAHNPHLHSRHLHTVP